VLGVADLVVRPRVAWEWVQGNAVAHSADVTDDISRLRSAGYRRERRSRGVAPRCASAATTWFLDLLSSFLGSHVSAVV